MKTVNIHQAKTHLSRLIDQAVAGEEVVIARAGKPVARLVPVTERTLPRPLGLLAGQVRESPDCWGEDPDLESLFYGNANVERGPMEPGGDES